MTIFGSLPGESVMKRPLLTAAELETLCILREKGPNYTEILGLPKQMPESLVALSTERGDQDSKIASKCLTGRFVSHRLLTHPNAVKPAYLVKVEYERGASGNSAYEPGDSFGLYPELVKDEVDWLCERLQMVPNQKLYMTSSSLDALRLIFPAEEFQTNTESLNFSIDCAVEKLLGRLDFNGFPKKAQLRALADCCPADSEDGWQLAFLSSQQGSSAYNRLRDEFFSIQGALAAFSLIKLSPSDVLRIVAPLQPRYYSCCSVDDGIGDVVSFEFVFNMSDLGFGRKGVASTWIERQISLEPSVCNRLPLLPRSIKHFRLPKHDSPTAQHRILMIAAGTGVAPFIGFLRQKQFLGWTVLQTCLFFGFRNDSDFLFREELKRLQLDGMLNYLIESRSRDEIAPKRHVQESLIEHQEFVYEWLSHPETFIYICGDELTMIKGVNDALISILRAGGGRTEREAELQLLALTKEKRLLRDIWI